MGICSPEHSEMIHAVVQLISRAVRDIYLEDTLSGLWAENKILVRGDTLLSQGNGWQARSPLNWAALSSIKHLDSWWAVGSARWLALPIAVPPGTGHKTQALDT